MRYCLLTRKDWFMYKITGNQIRLSVRNLVEFVLRSGSIDNRMSGKARNDAMQLGSRLHRKIQKSMGSKYQAEVAMKHAVMLDEGIELVIEGRADGILTEDDRVIIDEIKTISITSLAALEEPFAVHRAQAICYAYMYALQKQLEVVTVQVTYCQSDTEEIRRFSEGYSFEQLKEVFMSYVHEYGKWAQFIFAHRRERNQTITGIQFPFAYRPGQRNLVVASYRAMMKKECLMIQAPTGIGKTMSVLFPAVVTMGQGLAEKIFYLTAKTITRSVAEEGLAIMKEKGVKLSSVTITAKEKLCLQDEMECNPLSCSYADGHFDRVNAAVYDLICNETQITREVLLAYAKKHRVCPFELCLDVTYWVDIIICDYNYVFDPNVRLQRYFAEEGQGDYVFLIDEAHNLVERARDMYSASLCKEDLLEAKKIYKELPHLVRLLDSCNRKMLQLKRECDTWKFLPNGEGCGPLILELERLFNELSTLSETHPHWQKTKESSEFYFQVRDFLMVYEELDENYRVYTEHTEDGKFVLHQLCVNPSKRLERCCKQGISSIFFSATLLPIQYYKELLCGNIDVPAIYARSPFDSTRRLLAVASDVTTKYTRRTQTEYVRYARYISKTLQAKKGNYLIFFPSYRYLQDIMAHLDVPQEYEVLVQDAGMTEADKEVFLQSFQKKDKPCAGFCVIGGVFSEGIDLQEEALIGVIIAGTGLAQVSTRQEVLKQFYEEQKKDGYMFAYLYPGMNKVLQAAGRLIRTSKDYGVLLLLDERFLKNEYQEQFPVEWDRYRRVQHYNIETVLKEFWEADSWKKERKNENERI